MKFKVFSIFDSAAAAFLPPWCLPTEGMALRQLKDLPDSQPAHQFVKHAEQFTLFQVAEFDDSTGVFSGRTPEAVVNLHVLFSRRVVVHGDGEAIRDFSNGHDPETVMEGNINA